MRCAWPSPKLSLARIYIQLSPLSRHSWISLLRASRNSLHAYRGLGGSQVSVAALVSGVQNSIVDAVSAVPPRTVVPLWMPHHSGLYAVIAAVGPAATAVAQSPEALLQGTTSAVVVAVGYQLWRLINSLQTQATEAHAHREREAEQWKQETAHREGEQRFWDRATD